MGGIHMNMNATAQMRTTTQVGCSKAKSGTLAHAFESERELRKQYEDKLKEARKLLFAVQPFCAAWAAFDLADEIKDFLDGRPKKRKGLHGQEKRKGPPKS